MGPMGKQVSTLWYPLLPCREASQSDPATCFVSVIVPLGHSSRVANSKEKTMSSATNLHLSSTMDTINKRFLQACKGQNAKDVERLILDGTGDPSFDINCVDESGYTALHHSNTADIVQLLIKNGISVNRVTNDDREHALHVLLKKDVFCVVSGKVIHLFRNGGANLNAIGTAEGCTPLHIACRNFNFPCVEALLDRRCGDVDVNITSNRRMTPLHDLFESCKTGVREDLPRRVMQLLLNRGADVTARDNRGYTPLHYVAQMQTFIPGIVSALVKKGADINARANNAKLPLHCAIKGNKNFMTKGTRLSIIEDLLKNGANPTHGAPPFAPADNPDEEESRGSDDSLESDSDEEEEETVPEWFLENDSDEEQSKASEDSSVTSLPTPAPGEEKDIKSPIEFAVDMDLHEDFFRLCMQYANYEPLFETGVQLEAKAALVDLAEYYVSPKWYGKEKNRLQRLAQDRELQFVLREEEHDQKRRQLRNTIESLEGQKPAAAEQVPAPEPLGKKNRRS